MIEAIQGNIVSFNVESNMGMVMSNTATFVNVEEEEKLYWIRLSYNNFFMSKEVAQKYILTKVNQTENGYDHHFIFTLDVNINGYLKSK